MGECAGASAAGCPGCERGGGGLGVRSLLRLQPGSRKLQGGGGTNLCPHQPASGEELTLEALDHSNTTPQFEDVMETNHTGVDEDLMCI